MTTALAHAGHWALRAFCRDLSRFIQKGLSQITQPLRGLSILPLIYTGATSTQTGTFHLTKRSEPGGLSKRPSKDNFGQASAPKLLSSTTKKPNSREESEVSVGSSIEEDVLSDNPAKSEWLRARKIGKTQSDVMSLSSPTPKLMTSLRKVVLKNSGTSPLQIIS